MSLHYPFGGYTPLTLEMLDNTPGQHHTEAFKTESVQQGRDWEKRNQQQIDKVEKKITKQRHKVSNNLRTCSLCEFPFSVKPNLQTRQELVNLCYECYKKVTALAS